MEISEEDLQSKIDEATSGLKFKNAELIGKLKKATKDSAVEPEEFNRLKEDHDALIDKFNESQKLLKATAGQVELERKAKESESNFVQRLLIDNGLSDAMTTAKIKPELLKAAKALFASQAQVKIDGENRSAVIGDKPLSEAISLWAASDEGKHFIAAPANGGGGSHASGGGQSIGKQTTRAQFDNLSPKERMSFAKEGGKIVD